jgi:hypothetical protein
MIGATTLWLTTGGAFFGAVLLDGLVLEVVLVGVVLLGVVLLGVVLLGVVLLGVVLLGVVLLGVVLLGVVLLGVVLVAVFDVELPVGGAAVPPVGRSACATGAYSANAAKASARFGNIFLGEVIKTMPAGAPQIIWNTPESVTSRFWRCRLSC